MVTNAAWVCFECRRAVRRPKQHDDDVPCPECGQRCWPLGHRIPVPPRRDVRAWQRLHEAERARQHTLDEDAQRAAVRARHDLEQEIRRLEALPQNPGRTRSIKLLRKRLESPPG